MMNVSGIKSVVDAVRNGQQSLATRFNLKSKLAWHAKDLDQKPAKGYVFTLATVGSTWR